MTRLRCLFTFIERFVGYVVGFFSRFAIFCSPSCLIVVQLVRFGAFLIGFFCCYGMSTFGISVFWCVRQANVCDPVRRYLCLFPCLRKVSTFPGFCGSVLCCVFYFLFACRAYDMRRRVKVMLAGGDFMDSVGVILRS